LTWIIHRHGRIGYISRPMSLTTWTRLLGATPAGELPGSVFR
jgi:hypothetical protein